MSLKSKICRPTSFALNFFHLIIILHFPNSTNNLLPNQLIFRMRFRDTHHFLQSEPFINEYEYEFSSNFAVKVSILVGNQVYYILQLQYDEWLNPLDYVFYFLEHYPNDY